MDQSAVGPGFVALHTDAAADEREAALLVRRALRERGEPPWGAMEIELYPGREGSLILARRAAERVYIAAWALRFLSGRFGV